MKRSRAACGKAWASAKPSGPGSRSGAFQTATRASWRPARGSAFPSRCTWRSEPTSSTCTPPWTARRSARGRRATSGRSRPGPPPRGGAPCLTLGSARAMVLAALLGARPSADAFFIAYRIPNLLRELFAEGSMSAAFIPVFSEYLAQRTKRDAWELASAAFTTLLTILTGVCVLGIFASPWIVRLIAPGFSGDAEQQALTTLLTRIMFPYLLFIGLAALAMGVLNSVRSFAAPAFSPVLFNIAIIAAAFLLAPLFAEPILAVAVGVVIGGLAHLLPPHPALCPTRS